MIDFFRGLKSKYNVVNHGSGVYFTTDTQEIIHQGKSYSGIIKDITINDGNIQIVYNDDTTKTLNLPDSTELLIQQITDETSRATAAEQELFNNIDLINKDLSSKATVGNVSELRDSITQTLQEHSDTINSSVADLQNKQQEHADTITTINSSVVDLQNKYQDHNNNINTLQSNLSTVSATVAQHDSKISAHTQELVNIAYEQGVVAAQDSHAWYTQKDGLNITMNACYNLIGDYCILNVHDCMLCQGWVDLYYSLPPRIGWGRLPLFVSACQQSRRVLQPTDYIILSPCVHTHAPVGET